MIVKDLVKKLKKMPQNLDVAMASFDQPGWCAGDWVCSVEHIVKDDVGTLVGQHEKQIFYDMPNEYVVLHG